jgi:hypothetical protein
MMYIGSDKETIRSYCGYYGHIRQGKCGDNKVVGLARKGYFELLGFGHKIGQGRWVIHAQSVLCEAVNSPPAYKEGCVGFKEKISLSPCVRGSVGGEALEGVKGLAITTSNNNNTSEKERNFSPKIYGRVERADANLRFLEQLAEAGKREVAQ